MLQEIAGQAVPAGFFDSLRPASDRAAWEKIPRDYREKLVEEGEKWMDCPFSPIYATDYMEFCRTGNRTHFEDKMFGRRTALNALVLAECVQHEGRFLDTIINGMVLICEETAWQLPAHNSYIRDTPQHILPDVTRPVVDLFAAETGAVLAVAEYLLRKELHKVSPVISKMIDQNLNTRIFTPYLNEHFWWMGDGNSHVNNWTPWCTQNVLTAAFTRELDREVRERILQKACKSLDYFLLEYGEDGCCDEGAQYYRHAGLTLWGALEILNQVCGQAFCPLYGEPKIRNMADYIRLVHVSGPYYVNFADCSPMAGPCSVREYRFGKATDNRGLMAFAAKDYQGQPWSERLMTEEHSLLYRVWAAFFDEEMRGADTGEEEQVPDCWYPSAGLFIARDRRFCLAVKAGDNDDSHNHNDVGSFTVYRDGVPMFIDVGVESYTRKTFSPQRYEIWTMQSGYHNLPAFGGVDQKDGKEFGASHVRWELGEERAEIEMELAGAYPEGAVSSYVRKVHLEKGGDISVMDTCRGSRGPAVLSLMTYERPKIGEPKNGVWVMEVGTIGGCLITGAAAVETEEIPVTDPRLQKTWKHNIFRTLVTFGGERLELVISGTDR
ncbi:MAG: heparinase [Hungatella sp.]|nr:heparinase [Hungatella sp.]